MDPALAKEVAVLAQSRVINEAIARGDSEIQRFYKDATIFITGGTGFMGKQLIEKLFRSCDIKKVFLLMRPKRKKNFHERLGLILEDPVFDTVKKMKPGFEEKIFPVQGDVAHIGLGLDEKDYAAIIEETEIIIHGAATINFDEVLKVAVLTNVRGTVEMLNLGKQCKNLKSYVHISTAYAHTTRSRINENVHEQFYDAPVSPKLIIEMVTAMDEKRINDITPELIQNWPNTYTFTKAIGEDAVRQVGSDLPITIVRPAIVISSHQEPSPGWLDVSCAYGPSGLILGSGLGVIHTLLASINIKIDLVPVDLVNNAIIAAGYLAAKRKHQGDYEPKIYTVTGARNFIYWNKICDVLREEVAPKFVSPKSLYYTFVTQTQYKFVYIFLTWLWHFIPAYFIDFGLWVAGKPAMAVKLYSKVKKHSEVLSYFTTNEWLSTDKNLLAMYNSLNATDKQIYNCDVATIDWKDMTICWVLGIRKYILKDKLQGTEYGLKKQYWFKILHYTVVAPLYFLFLYKMAVLAFSLLLYFANIVMSYF